MELWQSARITYVSVRPGISVTPTSDVANLQLHEIFLEKQVVQRRMVLVVICFVFFEIIIFCSLVNISDLVHDVDAIHSRC